METVGQQHIAFDRITLGAEKVTVTVHFRFKPPKVIFVKRYHSHPLAQAVTVDVKAAAFALAECYAVYFADKIIHVVVPKEGADDISLLFPACKLAVVIVRCTGPFAEIAGRLFLVEHITVFIVPTVAPDCTRMKTACFFKQLVFFRYRNVLKYEGRYRFATVLRFQPVRYPLAPFYLIRFHIRILSSACGRSIARINKPDVKDIFVARAVFHKQITGAAARDIRRIYIPEVWIFLKQSEQRFLWFTTFTVMVAERQR